MEFKWFLSCMRSFVSSLNFGPKKWFFTFYTFKRFIIVCYCISFQMHIISKCFFTKLASNILWTKSRAMVASFHLKIIFSWRSIVDERFSQTSHLNFLSPLWILMCAVEFVPWINVLKQKLQVKNLSWVWFFVCLPCELLSANTF